MHAPAMRDRGTVDVDLDRHDGRRLSSPSTPGGFDDDDDARAAADAARRDRTRRVRSTPAPPSASPRGGDRTSTRRGRHPPACASVSPNATVGAEKISSARPQDRTRWHPGGDARRNDAGLPRLSIIGVVPVVILLLLVGHGGVGADEGDEVASSWWHGPDPPEGEPTDLEREMFHERTPSCIVCQRAVHYLDENLS